MITTKGQMIKELKKVGIRKVEKEGSGALVSLEHLKYFQVVKLYNKYCA